MSDISGIIACSSGEHTRAAISVIRINGFSSIEIFKPFFKWSSSPKERYAHYSFLYDLGGGVLDSVIFIFFKAPRSFTGDNLLELHVHGNFLNVKRIIDMFVSHGFRPAEQGEFTSRAFVNGKMNLVQVEGLGLMLGARSLHEYLQGVSLNSGSLKEKFAGLHESFFKLKASVELFYDFLDDVGEESAQVQFDESLAIFGSILTNLYERVKSPKVLPSPPTVVLSGQVNAGKSSLFNNLLDKTRAIVSSEEGTTRDYISEEIIFKHRTIKIIDTAGLRENAGPIEAVGIGLANKLIDDAFFKILVINPSTSFRLSPSFSPDLVVLTHSDIKVLDELDSQNLGHDFIKISNEKFSEYDREKILDRIIKKIEEYEIEDALILPRQRDLLSKSYASYLELIKLRQDSSDYSLWGHQLKLLGHLLEELIGVINSEDTLRHIFLNFCIGK